MRALSKSSWLRGRIHLWLVTHQQQQLHYICRLCNARASHIAPVVDQITMMALGEFGKDITTFSKWWCTYGSYLSLTLSMNSENACLSASRLVSPPPPGRISFKASSANALTRGAIACTRGKNDHVVQTCDIDESHGIKASI